MSTIVESLTKDIVARDLSAEGAALLNKWEKTGLLEGLDNERTKNSMAVLLENQAKELLREALSMAAGDVEGFAAVAFPIVRRVFGGLIANELVSVQPMSLPSGLIFFLDFTYSNSRAGIDANDSVYGGGVTGSGIQTGVTDITEEGGGFYNLQNGYASPTGALATPEVTTATPTTMTDNTVSDEVGASGSETALTTTGTAVSALSDAQKKAIRYDADILAGTQTDLVGVIVVKLSEANMNQINLDNLTSAEIFNGANPDALGGATVVRRLSERGFRNTDGNLVSSSISDGYVSLYVTAPTGTTIEIAGSDPVFKFSRNDRFEAGDGIGSVRGLAPWGLEGSDDDGGNFNGNNVDIMPEIDIKVESIAVTANTKKLKAKWSPELAQDLNAYHNLDAEVELTSILSEQVALEIDQEILNDLVRGATAGTKYWSRRPGKFVNRDTGAQVGATTAAPDFTGTVSEWYETLAETINDVSANIHRKTLRGGANFVVCSPEIANLLEFTAGFRATVNHEELKGGQIGAVKVGALSKKFDVYVDPYFPRNVVLVGRRGNSFLESGYVYAPYVPLQVTPTIFGVEDFVPRKGVMTRYAKKMVRPDMYGLVVCQDLIG